MHTASICSWPEHWRSPVNTVDWRAGHRYSAVTATTLTSESRGTPMADALSALECSGYTVTDAHFGAPYVDRDEWHDEPHGHRRIHGGFADCDTRFTFYFPALEEWQGRLIMPLEGAHAGHEDFFGGALGDAMGGIGLTARLGGYMVESNMGHIGDDIDPKGGDDPTLYGHRASAEVARFSKHIAAQDPEVTADCPA